MQVVRKRMRRKRHIGWESRATVKWRQSRIICSRAPSAAAAKKVKAAAQGCWGRHGRVAGLLVMVGKEVGVDHWAGQRKGCRSWQSWGMLYHHSEKARGSHVQYVREWEVILKTERGLRERGRYEGGVQRSGCLGSGLRIWWSRTWCWLGACWSLADPRARWCCPGSAYLRPSPGGPSAGVLGLGEVGGREEGGTKGGRETGSSGRPSHHTDRSSAHTRAMWI